MNEGLLKTKPLVAQETYDELVCPNIDAPNGGKEEISARDDLKSPHIDRKFFCFNLAFFPDIETYVLEHWIVNLKSPLLSCLVFFIMSLRLFMIDHKLVNIYEKASALFNTLVFFQAISFIFVVISFLMIIIAGPGYIPYNAGDEPRRIFSWKERMDYMTVYQEQVRFARMSKRPKRSAFAASALRFVLRADHYCGYANSFIGLKNARYFVLFAGWLTIFCIFYLISFVLSYSKNIEIIPNQYLDGFWSLLCLFITFPVLLFSAFHFVVGLYDIAKNITSIERHHAKKVEIHNYSRGCLNNFEEVCGPPKYILCWPFPIFCLSPGVDGLYEEL